MTDELIDKFLDGFLAGDGETANDPKFEELAAIVAATYAKSAWRTAFERGAKKELAEALSHGLEIVQERGEA